MEILFIIAEYAMPGEGGMEIAEQVLSAFAFLGAWSLQVSFRSTYFVFMKTDADVDSFKRFFPIVRVFTNSSISENRDKVSQILTS